MAGAALSARSQRLRIALAIPALLGLLLVGQAILDARGLRLDLTPEKRYSLSDQAERVLDGLTTDVRMLAFLRSGDAQNTYILDLLRRVTARQPRISLEIFDVNRSPALARQYGVESYRAVVVESHGRRRVFANPHEEILMAALLQVTRQERKTIGWLVGHGEGSLSDTDRRTGWSKAGRLLEQEYYEVRPVSLLADDVPEETAVLVIAGPQQDLLPGELQALERYLQRPGQALVLLDPFVAPELAAFLGRYGVDLRNDLVLDPSARLYQGEHLTMEIAVRRGEHPILGPVDTPPLFSSARSVSPMPDETGTTFAVPFLRTSEQSWVTTNRRALSGDRPVFLPGRDRPGPITVGLEVAFRVLTPPGVAPRQGRLIVYGNSRFANNFYIEFLGNKDLFLNTIHWLARDPQAIAARPRQQALGQNQFFVSSEQGDAVFWGTAVLQPATFVLLGLLITLRRRRS